MGSNVHHQAKGQRAVGYVRRSTDRQEQSVADQKRALQAYAGEHGLRLGKFYIDDAISGTSTVGRRAFQQMMQDAQKAERPFDLIVVYDVKRFGRVDNDEAGHYRYLLRRCGVDIRYVSENFNGDSTDDLLRPVKQWQARQESKDLSKVTIRGLLSKIDSQGGWWMGGVPPHGYDLRYQTSSGEFLFIVRSRKPDPLAVFVNSLVIHTGLADRHRADAGLNLPLAFVAVANHQAMTVGGSLVRVLVYVSVHLGLDRRRQHLVSALPQNLR